MFAPVVAAATDADTAAAARASAIVAVAAAAVLAALFAAGCKHARHPCCEESSSQAPLYVADVHVLLIRRVISGINRRQHSMAPADELSYAKLTPPFPLPPLSFPPVRWTPEIKKEIKRSRLQITSALAVSDNGKKVYIIQYVL